MRCGDCKTAKASHKIEWLEYGKDCVEICYVCKPCLENYHQWVSADGSDHAGRVTEVTA